MLFSIFIAACWGVYFMAVGAPSADEGLCAPKVSNNRSNHGYPDGPEVASQHVPGFVVRDVIRLPPIPVAEFEQNYSRPDVAVPIVFEKLMDDVFDPSQWTREALAKECGEIKLNLCNSAAKAKVDDEDDDDEYEYEYEYEDEDDDDDEECHSVRYVNKTLMGEEWAGLAVADIEALNITTLADLLKAQDTPAGSHLYLHDCAVHNCCPSAKGRLAVPKYFPIDYRDLESDPALVGKMKADHFPSLFISKKGSGSPLHNDADLSRFWVHLLSGKKLWRIFQPSENWRLYPTDFDDYFPQIFEADVMRPDFSKFPKLDGALVYETVLSAGEVIFVPEGWAHQVYNLEDSISTTLNFVDWHSMNMHLKYKEHTMGKAKFDGSYFHRMMSSYLMPIDLHDENHPEKSIDFDQYFNRHHFRTMNVPASVKTWVDFRMKYPNGIDSYRTNDGFPALHVAAMANFLSVVQYLLDHGADMDVQDYRGRTALEVVKKKQFNDIVECLEWYKKERDRQESLRAEIIFARQLGI